MVLSILKISLLLTIPLGPGAFLVMRTGLVDGWKVGFKIACGCILSDFLWVACSVRFPIFHTVVENNFHIISFIGGAIVFLVGFYIRFILNQKNLEKYATFKSSFFSSFFNGTIIISSTILLIKFAKGYYDFASHEKIMLVVGIGLGELIIWFVMLRILDRFRSKIAITRLVHGYGLIIMIMGIVWLLRAASIISL
jgi:threonine/homoserine/homoserine lactone efflux protein